MKKYLKYVLVLVIVVSIIIINQMINSKAMDNEKDEGYLVGKHIVEIDVKDYRK